MGGSSSYGALQLPATEATSKRSVAAKLVGLSLLALGMVAVVVTLVNKSTATTQEPASVVDIQAAYMPPAGESWAKAGGMGDTRPIHVKSNYYSDLTAAAQENS